MEEILCKIHRRDYNHNASDRLGRNELVLHYRLIPKKFAYFRLEYTVCGHLDSKAKLTQIMKEVGGVVSSHLSRLLIHSLM